MSPLVTDPAQLRIDYQRASLDERDVDRDPLRQFTRWFEEAVAARLPEPNAMTLATVGADGRPAARIVLLKEIDARSAASPGAQRFRSRCPSPWRRPRRRAAVVSTKCWELQMA